jgi:hypothetical protein
MFGNPGHPGPAWGFVAEAGEVIERGADGVKKNYGKGGNAF